MSSPHTGLRHLVAARPPEGGAIPARRSAVRAVLLVVALVAALLTAVTAQSTPAHADTWPLSGNVGVHDPGILHEGNTWWVASTGGGIPMKYSNDGHNWIQAAPIFRNELPWWRNYAPTMRQNDVWAPDMHTYNGRVWLYYSVYSGNHQSAIGLTSAPSVASGQWRDDGMVINSDLGRQSYNTIDPDLVFDANGAPWLVFGSWFSGIYVTRIDPVTMKPTGGLTRVAARPNGVEGPNIVYANGYYYLIVSFDHCCAGVNSNYKIAYGRSRSITGPYTDASGHSMLDSGGTILEASHGNIIGPGGQSVIRNGNGWLIIRHYYDGNANGTPKMLISDLYFDAAGWPTYTPSGPGSPPPPPPPPPPGGPCHVAYAMTNQWSGGFQAAVTITNTSTSPVNGWSLAWTFPNGQAITQIWNATSTASGAQVTARNTPDDGAIGANGGTVSFGFLGSWNGANNSPASFSLNGTTCSTG